MEVDINKIRKKNENIKIGELSKDVINLLSLECKPQNIYLWGARIDEHCEKHKSEYSSPTAYDEAVRNIPQIISAPDYVARNPKNGNVQYIKRLTDVSLVGIKITSGNKGLIFRTIFPITESKLNSNIKNGIYKEIK